MPNDLSGIRGVFSPGDLQGMIDRMKAPSPAPGGASAAPLRGKFTVNQLSFLAEVLKTARLDAAQFGALKTAVSTGSPLRGTFSPGQLQRLGDLAQRFGISL